MMPYDPIWLSAHRVSNNPTRAGNPWDPRPNSLSEVMSNTYVIDVRVKEDYMTHNEQEAIISPLVQHTDTLSVMCRSVEELKDSVIL